MPQFLITSKDIQDKNIIIHQKADIKHITEVLRCKIGEMILFIDEQEILYQSRLLEFSKDYLKAEIVTKEKSIRKLNADITLVQSIIKSSAQDFVIQKATELGVNTILPIISKYTVVKIDDEKDKQKKVEKWQKIALESCKQCERSKAPTILPIKTLQEVLKMDFDIKIACVERTAETSLKDFLRKNDYQPNQKIAVFIGPEGGWSNSEIESFDKNNIPKISLGNLILRAETATITALSGIIYEYEN
ncbi:MAG: RsmE family RNA methyltransferase [bacterium]